MGKMKFLMVLCYLMSLVGSIQTHGIPSSSSESSESSESFEETDGGPHHVKDDQQKTSRVVKDSYVNLDDDGRHQTVNYKDQRSGYVAQLKYDDQTKDPDAGSSHHPLTSSYSVPSYIQQPDAILIKESKEETSLRKNGKYF